MGSSCSDSMKPNSLEIIIWVSTSKREPIAIYRKCLNSISLFLLQPSAMLEGTETAAFVI